MTARLPAMTTFANDYNLPMVAQVAMVTRWRGAHGGTSGPWWHKKNMESCYDYLANGHGGMTRWPGAHGGTSNPWWQQQDPTVSEVMSVFMQTLLLNR